MACKWYAQYDGKCCCEKCTEYGDVCLYDEEGESGERACEFFVFRCAAMAKCDKCVHASVCGYLNALEFLKEEIDTLNCKDYISAADVVDASKVKRQIIKLYNSKTVLKMDKVDRLNFRKGLVAVDKMLTEMAGGKTE